MEIKDLKEFLSEGSIIRTRYLDSTIWLTNFVYSVNGDCICPYKGISLYDIICKTSGNKKLFLFLVLISALTASPIINTLLLLRFVTDDITDMGYPSNKHSIVLISG